MRKLESTYINVRQTTHISLKVLQIICLNRNLWQTTFWPISALPVTSYDDVDDCGDSPGNSRDKVATRSSAQQQASDVHRVSVLSHEQFDLKRNFEIKHVCWLRYILFIIVFFSNGNSFIRRTENKLFINTRNVALKFCVDGFQYNCKKWIINSMTVKHVF